MVEEFLYAIKSKLGLGPKSQKWKHWVAQFVGVTMMCDR